MGQSTLENKNSVKSTVILGVGTFLEYFDLMLYTHMAVVLTEVFFNHSDPYTIKMNSAYSFIATFCLKPVGSLIFGKLGDKIGRTPILIFSISIMAITCLIIAFLPSYEEIGFKASLTILICRALQGMSVVGESTAAELYVAEGISPPVRYYRVAIIGFCGIIGMFTSLLVAKTVLYLGLDWRIIFYIGIIISIVGFVARLNLRESKDYTDTKKLLEKRKYDKRLQEDTILKMFDEEQITNILRLAYFCVFCGWPVCFYFSYIHCSDILKIQFFFSKEEVISHNFYLSIINLLSLFIWIQLIKFIHPLKITRLKIKILFVIIILLPFALNNCDSPMFLLLIQSLVLIFGNSTIPSKAIFLMHIPALKRFQISTWYSSLAHVFLYLVTSMGLTYASHTIGSYGISMIFLVITIMFSWGINYFINLEKKSGDFDKKYNLLATSMHWH